MKEGKAPKVIETYDILAHNVKASVSIEKSEKEFVPVYILKMPEIEPATLALLDRINERLLTEVPVKFTELVDPKALEELKKRFYDKAYMILRSELMHESEAVWEFLAGSLVNEMLGLGKLEVLLGDGNLEDIVVNNASEPVWVYHKKYGWLKTNLFIEQESQIVNYSSIVGRKVGRQITTLNPLMDANLTTGDRVNATLFPISTKGNTISIRMFRRKPWVIVDLIENNTINLDAAALLWTCVQYEMNIIIAGGTAAGKTSFLNVLMPFIPINHRIISIEDTREIELPSFLHWVPLTTREPNPEGKGEVSMLDLLINSLRMRPDRIIVGEIRRSREAEVLFEAMHTGHSVYATLHADTALQAYRRLINPPIAVPKQMLESLDIIAVMFRDRRKGIRRLYEIAEIMPTESEIETKTEVRTIYKWKPAEDKIERLKESQLDLRPIRFMEKLKTFTGMDDKEIEKELKEKKEILSWLIKNDVRSINGVGKVIADYYQDPKNTLKLIRSGAKKSELIPQHM